MPSSRCYRTIPIDWVFIPRSERQRGEIEFEALKKSISKIGLLQPIVVEPIIKAWEQVEAFNKPEDRIFHWKLIAGECRLAACRELGLHEIPAITISDLTPIDSQIAELEENIKRTNLNWIDFCRAVARVHRMFRERNPEWSQVETAEALSITEGKLSEQLRVFSYLDDPRVAEAGTLREAYNIIRRRETRQRGDALMELLEEQEDAIEQPDLAINTANGIIETLREHPPKIMTIPKSSPLTRDRAQIEAESTIQNISFLDWAPTYSGQKFNFLHCDFYDLPYDNHIGNYIDLLNCLIDNLENLLSISAHVMFWFSERYRELTFQHFHSKAPSIKWSMFPLIWVKSNNAGMPPDHPNSPRHVYETCMLGLRGERTIVHTTVDAYAAPSDHRLHPDTKPESMLKHFMSMLVDEHTRMLDPTCGSGSSIRAAEQLGAKHLLGLEINPEYWKSAVTELRNRRMAEGFNRIELPIKSSK